MSTYYDRRLRDTYGDVLHLDNANDGVVSALKRLQDGRGVPTPLELGLEQLRLTGTFTVIGDVSITGTLTASMFSLANITGNAATATALQAGGADRIKLDGIASGATANSTDAQLRDRTTHTGFQAISTITSLQSSLDLKAPLASPTFTGTASFATLTTSGTATFGAALTVSVGGASFVGTNGTVAVNALGDQISYTRNGFNYVTASGASATLQVQATGASGQVTVATNSVERLRVDSSGRLLVNQGTWYAAVPGHNEGLLEVSNPTSGQGGAAGLRAHAWDNGTGSNDAGVVAFAKSLSPTVGTHTIVGSGNTLGSLFWSGSDGATFQVAAAIQAQVDGTPGTSDMPGRLTFWTTPDGSATQLERMRIDNVGRMMRGLTTALSTSSGVSPYNQAAGTTNDSAAAIFANFAADTTVAALTFAKSRGAAVGTQTVVADGDSLGGIMFEGSDGTQLRRGAQILSQVDGTPGSSDMPGRLMFLTTPDGSASAAERMRIDNAGRMLIGHTTSVTGLGSQTPRLQLSGTDASGSGHQIIRYSADTGAGAVMLNKSRGSIGTHTVVVSGDTLGHLYFGGSDGATFQQAAVVRGEVDGTPASSDMPGRLTFSTTPSGSATPSERARIDNAGRMLVGHTASITGVSSLAPRVQATGTDAATSTVQAGRFSGDASGPSLSLLKSRNASAAGHTVVQSGDALGTVSFGGSDGTNFQQAALIQSYCDGTPGSSDMPGRLSFWTTLDGAATPTERVRIDNVGRMLIGGVAAFTGLSSLSPRVQLSGTDAATSTLQTGRFSADANGAPITLLKSRNASAGSHTVVQSGDILGSVYFGGSDGSAFQQAAVIHGACDGTPGASDMPGRITFSTSLDGSATPSERMRIDNAGNVGIGMTPAFKLDLTGSFNWTGFASNVGSAQVDSSTAVTITGTSGIARVRLTGNATLTLPSAMTLATDGRSTLEVELLQDATGGRTVTWAAQAGDTISWDSSATAPGINTTASKETHFVFRRRQGSTVWRASKVWQES